MKVFFLALKTITTTSYLVRLKVKWVTIRQHTCVSYLIVFFFCRPIESLAIFELHNATKFAVEMEITSVFRINSVTLKPKQFQFF